MARSSWQSRAALALVLSLLPAAAPGAEDSRLVRKGVVLHNSGAYGEALALYQAAYAKNPSLTRLLLLMGACHLNLGQVAEALDHYERYEDREQQPRPEERSWLRGYYTEVLSRLAQGGPDVDRLGPGGPDLARARAHLGLGQLGEAVAAAERARKAAPSDPRLRPVYGRLLPRLLKKLEEDPKGAQTLLHLSLVYAALGQADEAARFRARYEAATAPPKTAAAPPRAVPLPPALPPRRPLWRLLVGGGLVLGGGVTAGFGVSALAQSGQCSSPANDPSLPPICFYEYDTSGIGAGLLVGGLVVTAAGTLLMALPPSKARRR